MDVHEPSLLWDERTACGPIHEVFVDRSSSESEGHGMMQTFPTLDYTSDHSLFSTTSSPTWYDTFDQPFFDRSISPNSPSILQGWAGPDLQPESYWDPSESSSAHNSDVDPAQKYDCENLRAIAAPPPPSPSSDQLARTPNFQEGREREEMQNLSCDKISAAATALSPNSAAPKRSGRSRRGRAPPSASSTHVPKCHKDALISRIPHNAVERKYREGLNAALKRLRRAVPTLPQERQEDKIGTPRLSKSMIIAGAIDYIERLESEKRQALTAYETFIGSKNAGADART